MLPTWAWAWNAANGRGAAPLKKTVVKKLLKLLGLLFLDKSCTVNIRYAGTQRILVDSFGLVFGICSFGSRLRVPFPILLKNHQADLHCSGDNQQNAISDFLRAGSSSLCKPH